MLKSNYEFDTSILGWIITLDFKLFKFSVFFIAMKMESKDEALFGLLSMEGFSSSWIKIKHYFLFLFSFPPKKNLVLFSFGIYDSISLYYKIIF